MRIRSVSRSLCSHSAVILANLSLLVTLLFLVQPGLAIPEGTDSGVGKNRSGATKRTKYLLFTCKDQTKTLDVGNAHLQVAGDAGTVVTHDSDSFRLIQGRASIKSAGESYRMKCRTAEVRVPKDTVCIFEQRSNGTLCLLSSNSTKQQLFVTLSTGKAISLPSGQAISIGGDGRTVSTPGQELSATTSCFRLKPVANSRRTTEPVCAIADTGTRFTLAGNGALRILTGWMFLSVPAGTRVETANADITASKPAIINLEVLPSFSRIGVCDGFGAVVVCTGSVETTLDIGKEVTCSASSACVFPQDGIARRRTREFLQPDGSLIVENDFSIYSLLLNAQHLCQIRKPISPSEFNLRERLLKSCLAIELVTGHRGGYSDSPGPHVMSNAPNRQSQVF